MQKISLYFLVIIVGNLLSLMTMKSFLGPPWKQGNKFQETCVECTV